MKIQKTKIALIELYGHNEVLYILYRLLKGNFEISVFTTQEIMQDAEDYFDVRLENWNSQFPSESKEKFIKRHIQVLNNQDIVIFITLVSSFRFFAKTIFEAKTIFLIHNVNTMLLPEQKLWIDQSSGINFSKDCLRFLIAKIRSNGFYKKQLLDRMIYISFPSSTLTDYAKSITNQYDDKIIESLPLSFYESYIMENNDSIIISVPGVVLEEARDYCMLYEAFKKLLVKSERTIQLQLLGNSNNDFGKKIVSKFQQLESDNFELIFFRKQISQRDYDKFLRKTDFMILPIQKYRKFGIIKEEYGESNISGGLNDIVRFGIPTLLIYSYKSERRFEPLISTFRDKDELVIKLNDWIENSRYLEIREAAQPILEKLNEENTRINLVKRIKKMLN